MKKQDLVRHQMDIHHVEDDKTMELVPSDLYGEVRYTGGHLLLEKG
jgi:hypothetical protein